VVPAARFVAAPAFRPLEEETLAKVEISKASTCFVSSVGLFCSSGKVIERWRGKVRWKVKELNGGSGCEKGGGCWSVGGKASRGG
jgi:hypothetical protein